jgi:hypothetical protein
MPPRWSRLPDRNDPDYRRLDDRMTFATHVAVFAATNSGLWFAYLLGHPGLSSPPWILWVTLPWLGLLLLHLLYITTIADYSA